LTIRGRKKKFELQELHTQMVFVAKLKTKPKVVHEFFV
jgi:hypothetical protein